MDALTGSPQLSHSSSPPAPSPPTVQTCQRMASRPRWSVILSFVFLVITPKLASCLKSHTASLSPEAPPSILSLTSVPPPPPLGQEAKQSLAISPSQIAAENTDVFGPEKATTVFAVSNRKAPVNGMAPMLALSIKPHLHSAFAPHLLKFQLPPDNQESCRDVSEELSRSGGEDVALHNLIHVLSPNHSRNMQSEKACVNSMEFLAEEIGSRHLTNTGDVMERLMQCYIDPKTRRGILQSAVVLGYGNCLQTHMSKSLLKGSANYDPALSLDAEGNTLMHLGVMSGAYALPRTLYEMEKEKNGWNPTRQMNVVYWMMSSLLHTNTDGKRPLQLATCLSVQNRLKFFFRAFSQYLSNKAQQHGIKDDTYVARLQDALKTSAASLIRPASIRLASSPEGAAAPPGSATASTQTVAGSATASTQTVAVQSARPSSAALPSSSLPPAPVAGSPAPVAGSPAPVAGSPGSDKVGPFPELSPDDTSTSVSSIGDASSATAASQPPTDGTAAAASAIGMPGSAAGPPFGNAPSQV